MSATGNQFRIGNIINYAGEPYKIVGIPHYGLEIEGIDREINNGCYDFDDVELIRLTDKLITKLGLIAINDFFIFGDHQYFGIKQIDEFYYFCYYSDSAFTTFMGMKPIKYLHEIQNVYFILYGEELTFKQ